MAHTYDAVVIGAGLAGAAAARELAQRGGQKVLLLERRPHIGGNCYDCLDEAGVLIHLYGPHIFHTDLPRVYEYLSQFTKWRPYQHAVIANLPAPDGDGRMCYPVPFNLISLEAAFGPERAALLEQKLLAAYGPERKVSILELRQNHDPALSALAGYVYEHVFVHYTVKQWGRRPEDIDPATTARVPVFLSRDCRYFQDRWQGMPLEGYTPMLSRMLDHPNIQVQLSADAGERLTLGEGILLDGAPFAGTVVYTGAVDELFGCRFGRLPYRTLDFQFETHAADAYQTHGTVNYTVDQPYTRITEFKHLTGQRLPGVTTILKEVPLAYSGQADKIPCYPVISPESQALYQRYVSLARAYPSLHLLGRLAEYKYCNMDIIVDRALSLSHRLLGV